MDKSAYDLHIITHYINSSIICYSVKCKYGCGAYGTRLTCPPYSPTPDETRRMLSEKLEV